MPKPARAAKPAAPAPEAASGAESIRRIPIAKLRPASYNPRKISPDELDQLKRSIQELGFIDPVLVNDRQAPEWKETERGLTIVGGHQRVRAASLLGMKTAPCVVLRLSPEHEKLANLALNKIGGDFDTRALAQLVSELRAAGADVGIAGFDEGEVAGLLNKLEKELQPPAEFSDVGGTLVTQYECPSCHFKWSGKPRPT